MLSGLAAAPLETLVLDGLELRDLGETLRQLPPITFTSLRTLSCRYCAFVNPADVLHVLTHHPFTASFDITGGSPSLLSALSQLPLYNALLALVTNPADDYIGFKMAPDDVNKVTQLQPVFAELFRHKAARKIASLRRFLHAKRERRLAEERRLMLEAAGNALKKLFNLVRVHRAKRVAARRRAAAWLIARTVRRLVQRVKRAKWRNARVHYLNAFRRRNLAAWRVLSATLGVATRKKQAAGIAFVNRFRVRKLVAHWRRYYAERKEAAVSKHACAVWQLVSARRCLASWKKVLVQTEDGTAARKRRFARQLHLALALDPYHNSLRQLRLRALADAFLRRRVLIPAWLCLYEDLHLARVCRMYTHPLHVSTRQPTVPMLTFAHAQPVVNP